MYIIYLYIYIHKYMYIYNMSHTLGDPHPQVPWVYHSLYLSETFQLKDTNCRGCFSCWNDITWVSNIPAYAWKGVYPPPDHASIGWYISIGSNYSIIWITGFLSNSRSCLRIISNGIMNIGGYSSNSHFIWYFFMVPSQLKQPFGVY